MSPVLFFAHRSTNKRTTMLKYLRRCFALRTELKALNAQIECGERPMLASPVEQKSGKLVWRIPIPGQSDAFMSIEAGHADYDRFVVPVHAAAFYRAWLAGGLQSSKRWDGCLLPSELATDYKYRHAVAGFAHGEQNPVPLARVGACYHKGTVKIGFTDGITRTFWLLANNVAAFPVMVADLESAEALAKSVGLQSEPLRVSELFASAKKVDTKNRSLGEQI
jgi:hypothetical protein